METASTEVTVIQRRNDMEKSTWKTRRYFVDFESRIHVKISTSNQFPRVFAFQNQLNLPETFHVEFRWRIDKDGSIELG